MHEEHRSRIFRALSSLALGWERVWLAIKCPIFAVGFDALSPFRFEAYRIAEKHDLIDFRIFQRLEKCVASLAAGKKLGIASGSIIKRKCDFLGHRHRCDRANRKAEPSCETSHFGSLALILTACKIQSSAREDCRPVRARGEDSTAAGPLP